MQLVCNNEIINQAICYIIVMFIVCYVFLIFALVKRQKVALSNFWKPTGKVKMVFEKERNHLNRLLG